MFNGSSCVQYVAQENICGCTEDQRISNYIYNHTNSTSSAHVLEYKFIKSVYLHLILAMSMYVSSVLTMHVTLSFSRSDLLYTLKCNNMILKCNSM